MKQGISRNGKFLKEMILQTNMTVVNELPHHEGTWTRINTKDHNQKSVIDYIIITDNMRTMITQSATDTEGTYQIKGINPTDHHIINMKMNLNVQIKKSITKQWRTGTPEQWKQYNLYVQKTMKQEKPTSIDNTTLTKTIIQGLMETIGKTTIVRGKEKQIINQETKDAKEEKKILKKKYKKAIQENDTTNLANIKTAYIGSQKKHREAIEKALQQETIQAVKNITKNGKLDMNTFWATRRNIMKKERDEYDILNENNEIIRNPKEAMDAVANYFEDLYQAREGETEYRGWTEHIEETVENITKKTKTQTGEEPITIQELNTAIKSLQRRKATGPDNIPNEAIIEASNGTRQIILELFNNIYETEHIPAEWREGTIIRIYKGKGKKGRCCNERGITLSSNLGKVYERIINNKIMNKINMTENQGGGRKGSSTTDHLKIINTYVKSMRRKKKTVYITFLDVTKAYDKAWLKGIIYALHKSGIDGKLLRITKLMNENLTAKIETKYGATRRIKIRDSIRQGGVLAVVAYANMMDQIAKEIQQDSLNFIKIGDEEHLGCLLWMDDVALLHTDKKQLQCMLDTTHEIASRYRIKFGTEKSKTIIIGKDKATFNIGGTPIEETDTYKYLGMTINNTGTLKDHLIITKGKVEATYQASTSIARHRHLRGKEMNTILKLHEACTIPTLLYGLESVLLTKKEYDDIEKINSRIMKRIIDTPESTPLELILMETDSTTTKCKIDERQMMDYLKGRRKNIDTDNIPKDNWHKKVQQTMNEYYINEEIILGHSTKKTKEIIKEKMLDHKRDAIMKASQKKSKVKHLIENNSYKHIKDQRGTYMMQMTAHQSAAIFAIRTRMLAVKGNYPTQYKEKNCRWCNEQEETQSHILNNCPGFIDDSIMIDKKKIMNNERKITKDEAHHLVNIFNKINEKKPSKKVQK